MLILCEAFPKEGEFIYKYVLSSMNGGLKGSFIMPALLKASSPLALVLLKMKKMSTKKVNGNKYIFALLIKELY